MMTNTEYVTKLKNIALNYKTLYVMGCFGAPMTASNKKRYTSNHSYNKQASRTAMINAASADTFGFDCVCLIKGVLWGWNGNQNAVYGGASYATNGVPDIGADTMITKCSGISTDFTSLVPGEAVWMEGHIGVYIGDGLAVECTPRWENKVQITACNCSKAGYNRRNWTKHGKLPYISYVSAVAQEPEKPSAPTAPSGNTEIKVGTEVAFKPDASVYYPNGPQIPSWVKNDYTHIVTQSTYNGKAVTRGGKVAVLLGKKVNRKTGKTEAGIMTWVALDALTAVGSTPQAEETYRVHTVVRGDTLWGIAQKYLGAGTRYREIMTLNGLTSAVIYTGNKLKIPNK